MNFVQIRGNYVHGFSGECFNGDLEQSEAFAWGFLYFIIVYYLAEVGVGWGEEGAGGKKGFLGDAGEGAIPAGGAFTPARDFPKGNLYHCLYRNSCQTGFPGVEVCYQAAFLNISISWKNLCFSRNALTASIPFSR